MLTHLSLFSGIGGIDLAAEWAGFTTVGQCEFADYPTKVLEKHWPDVPRWRDVKDVTADSFRERTGLHTVDLISGGFPCQPFSVAGKQKGKGDDRYLWPEMLRVIRKLKPRWILGENVPGILRIAADDVCKDLEREGYDVGIFDYEAAVVGAPHRRERVFFVANADTERKLQPKRGIKDFRKRISYSSEDVCNTTSKRLQNGANVSLGRQESLKESKRPNRRSTESGMGGMVDGFSFRLDRNINIWACEPDISRTSTGIKSRVDRLKCLGNAVVPQQVYPILQSIADIENLLKNGVDMQWLKKENASRALQ